MKCPHCGVNLKRRERSGLRCSKCKQEFALDPKTNRLGLHDVRLGQLGQKLSADGTLYYNADQLRYAAAKNIVAANSPSAGLGRTIMRGLLERVGLNRNQSPDAALPMHAVDFERDIVQRFTKIYRHVPQGLIDGTVRSQLDPRRPNVDALRGVIVCPEPGVRECLLANQVPTRFGLAVLPSEAPFSAAEQAHLEELKQRPALPLLVLHDASVPGCMLPQRVLSSLGLAEGRRVLDLGLRPRTAIQHKLMELNTKPSPELMALLQHSGTLDTEELTWLKQGKLTPILILSPARLLMLIERACQRLAVSTEKPASVEADPQQRAGAIGFMSWPE